MLPYFSLFTGFFLGFWLLRSQRHVLFKLAENSVAALNTLLTAEDDEDVKLKMVQARTNALLLSLLKTIGLFVLVVAVGFGPYYGLELIEGTASTDFNTGSFWSIMAISIGATIPFLIPIKPKTKSDYSELAQLLHRMVLNNYTLGYKLFKREAKKQARKGKSVQSKFVIVSGLARAGTTSLMNNLVETGKFSSLSYANMPFLLSPNTWAKFYKPKSEKLKERSHGDGIKIGLSSAEALEEYFFKVITNDSYITESKILEHEIDDAGLNDYLNYQRMVRLGEESVYLAKNNNFLTRYNSIRARNKDFVMVLLYRHPLLHAASLLEKHKQYTQMQAEDTFVLEYMDWLGHHEFGLHQKEFSFSTSSESPVTDKSLLDYWLSVWINYYEKVLTIKDDNTLVINYEQYCNQPNETINSILNKGGLAIDNLNFEAYQNVREVKLPHSNTFLEKAMGIYEQLKQLS